MNKTTFSASLTNLRQGPRKVRLVADLIRRLPVSAAQRQLQLMIVRPAKPLLVLLRSAMANAAAQGVGPENLRVESITVDGGLTLKRWMPRAHGRAFPIRQRASHVTLTVAAHSTEKK